MILLSVVRSIFDLSWEVGGLNDRLKVSIIFIIIIARSLRLMHLHSNY